ncbi:hypothetical protein DL771_003099 [Monosporascus sp. 5C6A]|nr:hypothetical protein DL771_003099 [Monosporascus sp. 5C6A]
MAEAPNTPSPVARMSSLDTVIESDAFVKQPGYDTILYYSASTSSTVNWLPYLERPGTLLFGWLLCKEAAALQITAVQAQVPHNDSVLELCPDMPLVRDPAEREIPILNEWPDLQIPEDTGAIPKVTVETMDPGIRTWLARKGLQDIDDVKKIEELGGTLSRGLLMVLQALPRYPNKTRKSPALVPESKNKRLKSQQTPHDRTGSGSPEVQILEHMSTPAPVRNGK